MSDMTPPVIEAKMRSLVNDLARAQVELAKARDAEVDAKHVYEAEKRRAMLSEECPKVTRGGTTTAERDAWVSAMAAESERDYDVKTAIREAARDRIQTLTTQAMLVQSLAKSVQTSMGLTGVTERG